ncbi:MAG: hypothetical protein C4341_06730 [Armatimonadota bacterium]
MTFEAAQIGAPALDDDSVLVRRFLAGDVSAFDSLYQRYYNKVYALARGILGDSDDALDALQSTFVQVWKNLPRFQQRSQFGTWLYRIAVNTAIQHARRTKRCRDSEPLDEASVGTVAEEQQEDPLGERVAAAMRLLREEDRALLSLYYWEEQSLEQIADVLGCSANAAKTRLYRARERFRVVWNKLEMQHETEQDA